MEHTKKKPEAVKKKKGKVVGEIIVPGDSKASEGALSGQEAEFWDETIKSLQGQRYENLEEAIHAVVDAAIKRLNNPSQDETEVREFLYDVLNMDPEILDALKGSLSIKNLD